MSLLSTHDLSIGYPLKPFDKELQRGLNLEIKAGQIVSLMGQNGVGKTTFIKSITGLLAPLKGSVSIGNKELEELSPAEVAQKISVVLTEKPASFNLTVIELLALGRHPYSNWMGILSAKDKAAIDLAIDQTNINYIADKRLYELSDGQLQKAMIARALVQETELILLDEPAAHLDLSNKLEVMLLLRQIADQGKGVLISTHDMQVSSQLSDELWLFNFTDQAKVGIPEDLILDGSLEKALFLEKYNYDMIHGTLPVTQESALFEVAISAPESITFWASRAFSRNRIKVVDQSKIQVVFEDNQWRLRKIDKESSHQNLDLTIKAILEN